MNIEELMKGTITNDEDIAKQMLWWVQQACDDIVQDISTFEKNKDLMISVAASLEVLAKGLRRNIATMK